MDRLAGQKSLQFLTQFGGSGIAATRVLFQAFLADGFQITGDSTVELTDAGGFRATLFNRRLQGPVGSQCPRKSPLGDSPNDL